jgi:hypothetical protein
MAVSITPADTFAPAATTTDDPVTISGVGTGTAAADRISVVTFNHRARGSVATGVTINGVTAVNAKTEQFGAANTVSEIWYAENPTGTSGDVVITFGDVDAIRIAGSMFAMYGAVATPTATAGNNGNSINSIAQSITIPADGGMIASCCCSEEGGGITWTNATEYEDVAAVSGTGPRSSSAYSTTAGTPTVTADGDDSAAYSLALAAWEATAVAGHPASKRHGGVPFMALPGRNNVW